MAVYGMQNGGRRMKDYLKLAAIVAVVALFITGLVYAKYRVFRALHPTAPAWMMIFK